MPPQLAVDLSQSGTELTIWDGGSGNRYSDAEFDVEVSDDGRIVTFTNTDSEAPTHVVSPASIEKIKEEYSYLKFSSDEEVIRVVKGLIRQVSGSAFGVYTGGKLTDLGLVVEDGDESNVLGLYVINTDGTFRRENKTWVGVDPQDDAQNEELESGLWVQVLDGAKDVFDSNESKDQITLDEFDGFVL